MANNKRHANKVPTNTPSKPRRGTIAKPIPPKHSLALASFASTRHGASNLTGVLYQSFVTCMFLLHDIPGCTTLAVRPEGDEDCDILVAQHPPQVAIRIQAKFRTSPLGLTDLADAFVKAWMAASATGDSTPRIAVVTNIVENARFDATGWALSVAQTYSSNTTLIAGLTAGVSAALTSAGGQSSDTNAVLSHAHVIHYPFDLNLLPLQLAVREPNASPLQYELAATALLAQIMTAAADNRQRNPSNAAIVTTHDVDGLLQQLRYATDAWVTDIDRDHLITSAGFDRRPGETQATFLAGVSAQPQHISAGYALPRPAALSMLTTGFEDRMAAIIVGQSGSGKSTLMWQAAYSMPAMRCFILHHLSIARVPDAVQFLRSMTPASSPRLLICADDIGHERMAGWSALLDQMASDSRVTFIATCREEQFLPSMARGGSVAIVRPLFDAMDGLKLARALGKQTEHLTDGDILHLHSEVHGLMMEFVHLLTTSERLADVLSDQAHNLTNNRDYATIEIARMVLSADICGLALPASSLRALNHSDTRLSDSLRILDLEHLITRNQDGTVRGVHPLRSEHLVRELHFGLPTLGETLAALMLLVPVSDCLSVVQTWARLQAGSEYQLQLALAHRLKPEMEPDFDSASELLLSAESALYAVALRGKIGPTQRRLTYPLLLSITGTWELGRSPINEPIMAGGWSWPQLEQANADLRELDELLGIVPKPALIRQSVLNLIVPPFGPIDPKALSRSTLQCLAGSDPFTAAQLHEWIHRLVRAVDTIDPDLDSGNWQSALSQQYASRMWAASMLFETASLGSTAQQAVYAALGREPIECAYWFLEQSGLFLVEIHYDEMGDRIRLLAPLPIVENDGLAVWCKQELRKAALVAGLESVHAEIMAADGTSLYAGGNEPIDLTGWRSHLLPQRVFESYMTGYQMVDNESSWFSWLSQTTIEVNRTAVLVEAIIGLVIRSKDSQAAHRINSVVDAVTAFEKAGINIPPPPKLLNVAVSAPGGAANELLEVLDTDDLTMDALRSLVDTLNLIVRGAVDVLVQAFPQIGNDHQHTHAREDWGSYFEVAVDAARSIAGFLEAFLGTSAHEAAGRLSRAVDALHTFAGMAKLPGPLARQLVVGLNASRPGELLTRRLNDQLDFLQNRLDAQVPGLGENAKVLLGDGWQLVGVHRDYRLGSLPLSRWALVSNPTGWVPLDKIRELLKSAPWTSGRVIVAIRGLDYAWYRTFMHWNGDELVPLTPRSRSFLIRALERVISPLKQADPNSAVDEALFWVGTLSRRACVERLGGVPLEDRQSLCEELDRLASRLPDVVYADFSTLATAVKREIMGGDGPSLSMEIDHFRRNPSADLGPLAAASQRCQLYLSTAGINDN